MKYSIMKKLIIIFFIMQVNSPIICMELPKTETSVSQSLQNAQPKKKKKHRKKKKFGDGSLKPPSSQKTDLTPPEPQVKKYTVGFILNEKGLEELAKKYHAGFDVIGTPLIKKAYLNMCALKHVFGIEIKDKNSDGSYLTLTGFHHDAQCALLSKIKPFYFSARNVGNGIREGFIAYNKMHYPVYKSFFSVALSREDVINLLAESLKNINKTENQKDKIVLDGTAKNGVKIRTVVEKSTGSIVTFFPLSLKPEKQIKAETKALTQMFEKHFFKDPKKEQRLPITPRELDDLYNKFKDPIAFNIALVRVNGTIPTWDWKNVRNFSVIIPEEWFTKTLLIPFDKLPALLAKYPSQLTLVKKFENFYFKPEVLSKIFSSQDAAFPPHMSRVYILETVKQILQKADGSTQFSNEDDIGELWILGESKGKTPKEIFTFLIKIDKATETIIDFYPLVTSR